VFDITFTVFSLFFPNHQNNTVQLAKKFLDGLARLSENQLLQYDNMLVIDDVEKGRKLDYYFHFVRFHWSLKY